MATWTNWSGRIEADAAEIRFVRSIDDLRATVAQAASSGRRIRVAGTGHSHFPLVPTDGVIVDASGLVGVRSVADGEASIWAGTPIATLGHTLHGHGVALSNQGDIDRQTIAGATATGTHGTGRTLSNLSATVTSATFVTADGELLTCSADEHPDVLTAARLHLGAFGVVAHLTITVVPAYRLAERGWRTSYGDLRPTIAEHVDRHRHFEFFWYPTNDQAIVKTIDVTDSPAEYPVGREGSRVAWSYEVLPNHRPVKHTEMEFAVPIDRSLECLDEIRSVVRERFTDLAWPIEYRTVAGDDVWLSPAFERDVATISVHQGVDRDDGPLFRACEAVFRRYDGRPHWGKVHYFDRADLAAAHPRWDDWWRCRDAVDPDGVFLDGPLSRWRG